MMSFDLLVTGLSVIILSLYGLVIIVFTFGFYQLRRRAAKLPLEAVEGGFPIHMNETRELPGMVVISVILPVRNEQNHILRVLEEIRLQDYPAELLEMIVSDDFSEDQTVALTEQYAAGHTGFRLKLTRGAKGDGHGKKQTLTRAVRQASGQIILTTDADTYHGTSWVRTMVAGFSGPEIRMVLGPVTFTRGGNLLQRMQAQEFAGIMGTTAGSAAIGHPVMCNGANLGFRREVFTETGGYDGNLRYASGDDQFLMSAVKRRYGGRAVVFLPDPNAMVTTEAEASLQGFLQQRIRWVSKSPGYRDVWMAGIGMVVWITGVMLLAGLIAGVFVHAVLSFFLLLWAVKMAIDYPLVLGMQRFSGEGANPGMYLLAQMFQLIYMPLISVAGLILPFRWKGRHSRVQ